MRLDWKWLAPVLALALGALGAAILVATTPQAEVRPPARRVPVVRVLQVEKRDVQFSVRTHGTVAPRTESDLVPQVTGPVVWVSPAMVSGGFFEADEVLLRIDPRDYEAALEQALATLARRQSEHARTQKELSRQRGLAERNISSAAKLDDAVNADNVAAAGVRGARASAARAERDLERTEIRAAFPGRVREERVDVGQFLTRGASIGKLYAVDLAEVRLPVPDEELAFLDLPGFQRNHESGTGGPGVRLSARFAGKTWSWTGRVVRTEGEIDPHSRMVHVVAQVDDPYGRTELSKRPPLAVGLFVEAEIEGRIARDVVVLPRAVVREGDRVLVVDEQNRLHQRDVEVLRTDRNQVVIRTGLRTGERVCVSPLESFVDGMEVRVSGESDELLTEGTQAQL